jgi:DNA-binding NtrC family response regulator
MKVAVVAHDDRVRKSLLALLRAFPEVEISFLKELADSSIPNETDAVIIDIESVLANQGWPIFVKKHPVILYSHSKEFAELVDWLHMYKADFFNVYTHPDCVLHLIKKACRMKE